MLHIAHIILNLSFDLFRHSLSKQIVNKLITHNKQVAEIIKSRVLRIY